MNAAFKTDGIDGRTGSDTVKAILAFQKKAGMQPADGYAGLKVLARLRQAPDPLDAGIVNTCMPGPHSDRSQN